MDNLIDGVNFTSDDLHAWLAPFSKGSDHIIVFEMDEVCIDKRLHRVHIPCLILSSYFIECVDIYDSNMELQ